MKQIIVVAIMLLFGICMMIDATPASTHAPVAYISWHEALATCGNGCTYNVWKGPRGSETLLISGLQTLSYQDPFIVKGRTYCWKITATDTHGTSGFSSEVCKKVTI